RGEGSGLRLDARRSAGGEFLGPARVNEERQFIISGRRGGGPRNRQRDHVRFGMILSGAESHERDAAGEVLAAPGAATSSNRGAVPDVVAEGADAVDLDAAHEDRVIGR